MWKYILVFIVLITCFGAYQIIKLKHMKKTNYPVFNNKKLEGKIIDVRMQNGLTYFKLDNLGKEYSFIPVSIKASKAKLFDKIAEPGDSIFKMPHSDTIVLKHKGEKYYYTSYEF
jgi:hypothetical protein